MPGDPGSNLSVVVLDRSCRWVEERGYGSQAAAESATPIVGKGKEDGVGVRRLRGWPRGSRGWAGVAQEGDAVSLEAVLFAVIRSVEVDGGFETFVSAITGLGLDLGQQAL
jgi:hypothetical protein